MKKYSKPNIYRGANVVYYLSIGLETWCQYAHPLTITEDKPQMFFAAKIIHEFFLQQRICGKF